MIKKFRDFVAQNKFKMLRGQAYVSLFFWILTFINVIIINGKEFFEISLLNYILVSVIGGIFIFFTVWFIGYLDVKIFKVFSAEQKYQHELSPIMVKTLENTNKILEEIYNDRQNK